MEKHQHTYIFILSQLESRKSLWFVRFYEYFLHVWLSLLRFFYSHFVVWHTLFLEINCGPPGILHNGWMENLESGTGLGASIIFRCDDGMLMVGNASTVCQADGKWRYSPPLCLGKVPYIYADGLSLVKLASFSLLKSGKLLKICLI